MRKGQTLPCAEGRVKPAWTYKGLRAASLPIRGFYPRIDLLKGYIFTSAASIFFLAAPSFALTSIDCRLGDSAVQIVETQTTEKFSDGLLRSEFSVNVNGKVVGWAKSKPNFVVPATSSPTAKPQFHLGNYGVFIDTETARPANIVYFDIFGFNSRISGGYIVSQKQSPEAMNSSLTYWFFTSRGNSRVVAFEYFCKIDLLDPKETGWLISNAIEIAQLENSK